MSFLTLMPLILAALVPVIIILYLMKPKGEKRIVPSLMLWKNAEKNERSVTFAKKLIRNILMFLEIAALLLLMLAAMSPIIKRKGTSSSKSGVIVIDTTGSMQFEDGSGKSRFEQAVNDAKDYVDMSSGEISIITSGSGSELLVNSSRDKLKLKRTLSNLKVTDSDGKISDAESLISTLDADNILILTDAKGAEDLEEMANRLSADVKVYGKSTPNVGLTRMSMKRNDGGLYDIAAGYQITGGYPVSFDISLFDEAGNLLEVRTIDTEDEVNGSALFLDKDVSGKYVKAEISAVSFHGEGDGKKDGLDRDNTAFAVSHFKNEYSAYLVGAGNTYFEKAYQAATGDSIIKVGSDSDIAGESKENVIAIYDRADMVTTDVSRLIQGYSKGSSEKIDGAMVTVKTGKLINDMSDFSFGAGDISVLNCPEWATPLMMVGDKVVAYYGQHDGIREVVLGFDIRNSEYPLMAEFPIFVTDCINYLTESSLIVENSILAGERLELSPSAGSDIKISAVEKGIADENDLNDLQISGLYKISGNSVSKIAQSEEYFVVNFPTSEGDGTGDTESLSFVKNPEYGTRLSSLRRLCLILAFIILVVDWIIYVRRNRVRKGLDLYVRIALMLLILAAIFEISIPSPKRKTATIFVVDMSDSNKSALQEIEGYLSKTISAMPSGEMYGIVTFGRDSMTDQFVTDEPRFLGLGTVPNASATDIEGAISYAISMIPDNRAGRVVLLTDGKETVGDVNATLKKLQGDDIELCARVYEPALSQDTYIQFADMPEQLATGDAYNIKVTIYSTYDTAAKLKVSSGSEELETMDIMLTRGENTFVIKEVAGEKAVEEKTITVEAAGDEIEQNNSLTVAAMVEAPERVLLISGTYEDSTGFEKLLKEVNVDLSVVSGINAPDNLIEMLQYKTIIIDNCHLMDLAEGFVANVESYVRDYGGGIVMAGGKESFAPGGYRESPFENVLPVSMMPRGLDEAPSLAMVMVIDCSGSMSSSEGTNRSKIDIAVDAALEAVDNLSENDYVGVLTFSDSFEWRQTIVKVTDKDSIKQEIEKIGIEGGTVIKPGLMEAANSLTGIDAGVKHIILLTDGEGETQDFDDAIELINNSNITLSSVAVGSDSDQTLLENLARSCGGRYYYSDSSSDVPKIFAEEVFLSGDTYFKHGDYDISISSHNELVDGLYGDGLPQIHGYIATTIKNGAREIMNTSEDDPLLASWQYGLGHTVAWTTNGSGTWDEALAGLDDYPDMWKKILDYTAMESNVGKDNVSVYKRRDRMQVSYDASEYSENTNVKGVYTSPSGKTGEIEMISDEPGHYTASFTPEETGVYSVNVVRTENGETAAATAAIETVQFSDEYKWDISNSGFVSFVEKNGRILDDDSKVFTKIKSRSNAKHDITMLLIILSAIILMLDIVIRRFDMDSRLRRAVVRRRERKQGSVKTGTGNVAAGKAGLKKKVQGTETGEIAASGADTGGVNSSGLNVSGVNTSGINVSGTNSSGINASGMGATENTFDNISEKNKGKKPEKVKKKDKKAPAEQPDVLDTSALLKKKRDRNM